MNPLLQQFINESRDLTEEASSALVELESAPQDAELLNRIFRAVHTIKGSAGLFDYPALTRLIHAAEDVMDAAREGGLRMDPAIVDKLLAALDTLEAWLGELETSEELTATESHETQIRELRALVDAGEAPAAAAEGPERAVAEVPWLGELGESELLAAFSGAARGEELVAVSYTPAPDCFFKGEDPLRTLSALDGVVALAVQANEPWPELDALDPFHAALTFRLLATGEEAVRAGLQYVMDDITLAPVAAQALIRPNGDHEPGDGYREQLEALQGLVRDGDGESATAACRALLEFAPPTGFLASCGRWLLAVLDQPEPRFDWAARLVEAMQRGEAPAWEVDSTPATGGATAAPGAAGGEDAAREILGAQQRVLDAAADEGTAEGRTAAVMTAVRRVLEARDDAAALERLAAVEAMPADAAETALRELIDSVVATIEDGPPEAEPAAAPEAPGAARGDSEPARSGDAAPSAARKPLKVDPESVDELGDLMGELVVAKNGLPYLIRRVEHEFGLRELAREMKEQFSVLHRISKDMQETIMRVQMLPVSQIFQRFPRLVRDLSRKLDKEIELTMEGEETEADKNVIDVLSDPVVHMVRNSIDHGIETPEEREAAGKPRQGTLRIAARHEGENIRIEIADDGKGIDAEGVKRKAYAKGLVDESELEQMSEEESLRLVFLPGLSTRDVASDVSGRGVGMDSVLSSVKKCGGAVSIQSELGQGTTVVLSLPLTMTVSHVMEVEVDGQPLGIAMNAVVETVRVPRQDIQRIKSQEGFVLRDRLVPVRRLRRLLELPERAADEEEAVLVVNVGGERLGLVVDDFNQGVEVILKPLEGIMANVPGYSGSAVLGDGQVMLVLDLGGLV